MTRHPETAARSDLDLSDFLCFALYSANNAVNRAYRPLLDRLGLTYPQYLVMVSLWQRDAQPVGAIGRQLMLDSGTLTPVLKRLEAAGLIERRRSRTDERLVIASLTAAGDALRRDAAPVPGAMAARMALPAAEASDLKRRLSDLRDRLSADPEAAARTP